MTESNTADKIVLYSRPWSVELHLALEDHWQRQDRNLNCEHMTQHLEVARRLEAEGRTVRFLTREVATVEIEDPIATLAELESSRGTALHGMNRYRLAERYFEGRDPAWQLDQIARYAVWLDRYFAATRPLAIVGESPDILPLWLAYDLARGHGTEVVAMIPSVVPPDRVYPLDDYARIPGARERYEELAAGALTDADRERARRARDSAPYGAALSYLHSRTPLTRLKRLLSGRFFREQLAHNRAQRHEKRAGNWFVQPRTSEWVALRLASKIRGPIADRRYLTAPKPTRPFLFFPLHFQPEASTLIAGSYFVNQLEVIKNLARSVPIDWEIAVKEHFWMRGQRRLDFYRELQRIPNVTLTSLEVPTEELIDEAAVVAVISSNAGLEAALRGKGVLTFGEAPWDYGPTVRRVGALPELPARIAATAEATCGPEDERVLAFAASWDEALPEARYYEHPTLGWGEPENLGRIAATIEARLERRRSQTGAAAG